MTRPFEVRFTPLAEAFIEETVSSGRSMSKLEDASRVLAEFPYFGREYDPAYPAARTPFPCRELPVSGTPFTMCYVVDEDARCVTVIDIEWSAGDPGRRFQGL